MRLSKVKHGYLSIQATHTIARCLWIGSIRTMKLNDEQIENLTYSLYSNLMDFKQFNTGFIPEREDIIKCLDYALEDL